MGEERKRGILSRGPRLNGDKLRGDDFLTKRFGAWSIPEVNDSLRAFDQRVALPPGIEENALFIPRYASQKNGKNQNRSIRVS